MKRIVVAILIIITLFTTVAFAEATEPSYLSYSLSTMNFVEELKDRMAALDEKENPTSIDVELCLQYAEMYARLLNLSSIEMTAMTSDTAPELGDFDEYLEVLETIRSVYNMNLRSADEVIEGLVKGIIGE